ncbi:hypothetical protein [Paenibacillus sp. SI8]|uniref:hypothetical protein n=1 Tax=unclassified Paenibacillus TaxID=185978 RepID=UPI003465AC4A
MKKRIGCLHAHYSNIAYMEQAFASYEAELLHFVDPGLVSRVGSDEAFSLEDAQQKVNDQIAWIASCHVDAILVTCTNYVALLQEEKLSTTVPIIKIDEPFFQAICAREQPQILLFTNTATVEGTLERLHAYAEACGKSPVVDVRIIEHTFELIMQGKKEEYLRALTAYMHHLLSSQPDKEIAVAQLSMAEAARCIEEETGSSIVNPLETLMLHIEDNLELSKK